MHKSGIETGCEFDLHAIINRHVIAIDRDGILLFYVI